MAKVKYYYDLMSQPARALWIALRLGKTPYEDCPVALRKLEQHTEEYKKINRFQKVPCIVHGDFKLAESVAIVRYLSDNGLFCEKLYPKDVKNRARVDEFLEWQHMNVRLFCSMYFVHLWLFPMNGLAKMPSEERIKQLREDMEKSLGIIENIWLANSNYVAGDKLTVADLFGTCEVLQTKLTKYDGYKQFPKINAWIERVRAETNPYFDEGHKFIYKKSAADSKL